MSTVHDYVGGTRGSGIVCNAADVPGMSVMRGMNGGVCCCFSPCRSWYPYIVLPT